MADDMPLQQHAPGGHYSGTNKIPTVNQFLERLDGDKKKRDKEIDQQRAARESKRESGEVQPHQEQLRPKENQKTVTDPTTGQEVVIEDVNKDMVERAKNPVVSICRSQPPCRALSLTSLSYPFPMPT